MMPVDFEGSNTVLTKPKGMTDEQCMSVPAYRNIDDAGFPFTLTVWQPSKEDIDAINAGRPICLKVLGITPPPVSLFTVDENCNPNV
jgi:hypothetical protein